MLHPQRGLETRRCQPFGFEQTQEPIDWVGDFRGDGALRRPDALRTVRHLPLPQELHATIELDGRLGRTGLAAHVPNLLEKVTSERQPV